MIDWQPGLLLRINDYQFEDDGSTKDKYSIVLFANASEAFILHSLTTSRNKLELPAQHYGCSVVRNIPYYFIPKGQIIGNDGYYFDVDTFLFFNNNVRKEERAKFEKLAKRPFGIAKLGVLSNIELKNIITCALKSSFLTSAIAQELRLFLQTLSK